MPRAAILIALLFAAPAFAGCLGDDADAAEAEAPVVAASATDAGAQAGETPAAPKGAYRVSDQGEERVAYPLALATNPAKPPVTLDFSAEYRPQDCRSLNFGSTEALLREASHHRRFHDLSESLEVGDVFQYRIEMTYTNTEQNWAEIHPMYAIGATVSRHDGDVSGEVSIVWEGQSHRTSKDEPAFVGVQCYYGVQAQAIPYTLTVSLSFAEGAVPAEVPVRVPVPEGASRLMVRGVPIDEAEGVQSHFRLFGPDDRLVCECALGSADDVASVDLAEPGEYVLLVDHTSNGFVSVALDVPPAGGLEVMDVDWDVQTLFAGDGAAVDTTVEFELPTVPLRMDAVVYAREADAGVGRNTQLTIANARGEPLRYAWAGHAAYTMPGGGGMAWLGLPTPEEGAWEFVLDHHAYAPGTHTAHIKADALRGEVLLMTRTYVR